MSALKLDIGCGHHKTPGFIGVDRWPMPGVDIVCDVEQGIPLETDSVGYVTASHSLEHFRDLPKVIREIWRVCKDRARITIAAPYSATRLNQGNPYHLSQFNEHTPRFWTNDQDWPVGVEHFDFPGVSGWGLAGSDSRDWDVDIRLIDLEYFYFPEYRDLSSVAKTKLRQASTDVCDQFILNCIVVKTPITRNELRTTVRDGQWVETWSTGLRRSIETTSPSQVDDKQAIIDELASELQKVHADARSLIEYKVRADADIAELASELHKVHADARSLIEFRDWAQGRISELEGLIEKR